LGYALQGLNGLEVTRQIRAEVPTAEVLIFTAHQTANLLGVFLEAGAGAFIQKSEPIGRLIEAVRHLASHKPTIAGTSPGKLKKRNGSRFHLTSRESTIVQLIADGESNKRIAGILGISLKTVETHRANIMHKLELRSTADLVRYAVRNVLTVA
jgi:DNA-binding NarL/FixJ family response regulator